MATTRIDSATIPVSKPLGVKVTGGGTAWTGGTTFSVTGGSGSGISGLSVNVGGQTAAFILNPGSVAGALTISNNTDASTCVVYAIPSFTSVHKKTALSMGLGL